MNTGKKSGALIAANKKPALNKIEKSKRASEIITVDKELVFQNKEKAKRISKLIIANKELVLQNQEKEFEKINKDALINNTEDLIWSVSCDFKLIAANKAFIKRMEAMVGITLKPGDDLLMKDIFSEDYITFWQGCYEKVLSGESLKQELYTAAFNDSKESWADIRFNPVFNAETVVAIACYSRNITEKKTAEEKLRQSEARFAEAQSVAKVGSWETNLQTLDVIWSDETCRIFGVDNCHPYTTHENFLNFVHIDDKEKVDAAFFASFSGNLFNTIEHRIVTAGEMVKEVEERWQIAKDDMGNPVRAFGTIQDITERKRAGDKIKASEEKYRAFFENSLDGILLSVTDGEILAANPAACNIFRMSEEEIRIAGRDGLIDASGPRAAAFIRERQITDKAKGELTFLRKDGSTFPGETTSVVFKDSYGYERTSIIIRDITETKKAQESIKKITSRLQLATDSAGMGIWEWDIQKQLLTWDEGMYRLYKINDWEFGSAYDRWISMVHPQDKDRFKEDMQTAITGKKEYNTDFRITWPDASVHFIKATAIVERDDLGNGIRMTGANWDISQIKIAEQQLRKSEVFNRGVIDSLSSHIAVLDSFGNIIAVNEAWKRFSLDNNETTFQGTGAGNNYYSVCEKSAKAGEGFAIKALKGIKSVMDQNTKGFYLEYPCDSPETKRWFGMRAVKFESDVPMVVVAHMDITERKLAENKLIVTSDSLQHALNDLTKIMDSSLDVICAVNAEGRFVKVSAACEAVWGYTADELIGKPILDFVYPEDHEKTSKMADKVIAGNNAIGFENRYIRKDGSLVPISWSVKWDAKDEVRYGVARDVTEKKKLEKAFEIERKRFLDLFLEAPTSMGVFRGADHVFEIVNPPYLQLIGKKDIIGKSVKDVLPEIVDQGFIEILDQVYKTGKTFSANEMHIKLDPQGNGTFVDKYLNFIYQAHRTNESIDGILFFAVDVTEQVLSRKKIEESETKLKEAQAIAHISNWEIDLLTNTHQWSEEFYHIFGIKQGEVNPSAEAFLSLLHPEDVEHAKENMQSIFENFKQSFFYSRINTNDGSTRFVYSEWKFEFDKHKKPIRLYGILQDVTERKVAEEALRQSEVRFREFFENAPEVIVVLDVASLKFTKNNLNASKLFKFSNDEFGKIGLADISPEYQPDGRKSAEKAMEYIEKAILGEKITFEWVHCDADKKEIICEVHLAILPDASRPQIYASIINISERKKAQEERDKLTADIVQRNKDLEQFSYIISHNLRAPVANIIGTGNILNDNVHLSQEQKDTLSRGLTKSVLKLDTVIKDLNHILQVKREVNEVKEKVFFSKLVDDIKTSINNLIEKDDIEIKYDFSEVNEFATLKSYLYSIFYNLLSNSIKYRRPDVQSLIQIRSHRKNGKIELLFTDNGMGIDIEKKGDQVFGLYKRFHTNIEGKGMGLYMVKTQVEILGGKINIKSIVNKGTEFKIEFEI